MLRITLISPLIGMLTLLSFPVFANDTYTQHQNVVYAERHGVGLVMDIFVPPPELNNGHGIVDVASGNWDSGRGKIRDHHRAQVFDRMCAKGFTVFAVRPGSLSRYSAIDMLNHLNLAIVWVKDHADEYGIAAEELGLMGASAGGHLACLAAVTADDTTRVKSIAVFFPPTDFLDYGGAQPDPRNSGRFDQIIRRLAFPEGVDGLSDEQVISTITSISPARLVTRQAPPFLFIHGDADFVVPLQQSQTMVKALKDKQVSAELIIKPGGAHPWPTLHEEVEVMAAWFEQQLIQLPDAGTSKTP
jgi:acetyl esterase/lipase